MRLKSGKLDAQGLLRMGRLKTKTEREQRLIRKRLDAQDAKELKENWAIAKQVRQRPVKAPSGGSSPSSPANKARTRQKV